jgi:hypothetical protein
MANEDDITVITTPIQIAIQTSLNSIKRKLNFLALNADKTEIAPSQNIYFNVRYTG